MDFKRSYLPNNPVTLLFLLKPFVASRGRKCVKYFALGLTLKASLEMNYTMGTLIS